MADSATGGPGADRTYIVHYRRMDGTEATAPIEMTGDRGRYSWTAPEDCVAVTEIECPPAGGGAYVSVAPLARPDAVAPGMTFTFPEAATEREIREQAAYLAESGRTFTEGGQVTNWPLIIAEKDAEIARLTAELAERRQPDRRRRRDRRGSDGGWLRRLGSH